MCQERNHSSPLDHLHIVIERESNSTYACSANYLNVPAPPVDPSKSVDEAWRRRICEWCYEVVDYFEYDRTSVSVALNYVDRYFAAKCTSCPIDRRQFELVAITALYLSIKLHGELEVAGGRRKSSWRKVKIATFVELSGGRFSVSTIEEMELRILSTLRWNVNPSTPSSIITDMLCLIPSADCTHRVLCYLHDMARYQAELAVCVSSLSIDQKPSVIAYAAILNAMQNVDYESLPPASVTSFCESIAAVSSMLRPDSRTVTIARSILKQIFPKILENEYRGDEMPQSPTSVAVAIVDIMQPEMEK